MWILEYLNQPLTVNTAEEVWLPAWFWAWQEYLPPCLLCKLVMCSRAVLFSNVSWMFSLSLSSWLSFSQDTVMGSEPLRMHCRETSLPTKELRLSNFCTNDGGSTRKDFTGMLMEPPANILLAKPDKDFSLEVIHQESVQSDGHILYKSKNYGMFRLWCVTFKLLGCIPPDSIAACWHNLNLTLVEVTSFFFHSK